MYHLIVLFFIMTLQNEFCNIDLNPENVELVGYLLHEVDEALSVQIFFFSLTSKAHFFYPIHISYKILKSFSASY